MLWSYYILHPLLPNWLYNFLINYVSFIVISFSKIFNFYSLLKIKINFKKIINIFIKLNIILEIKKITNI